MFKYFAAVVLILICLVLLQYGCKGSIERFQKRMDERRQERQQRFDERRRHREERIDDRRDQRSEPFRDREPIFRHRFFQRRDNRRDQRDPSGDTDDTLPILDEV